MLKFCLIFLLSLFAFIGKANAAECSPSNPTNCYTLQLHYTFEEGSNQTTADLSGNNRHGTLGSSSGIDSNDPTWASDGANSYLDFSRVNSTRVSSPTFTPPADGVVAFWYKTPPTSSVRRRIFGFDDGWEIRWESDNVMYLDINKTGTNSSIRTSSPMTTVDTWIHIAVVTSATDNTWSVYINGVLDNSGSESLTARPDRVLTIGNRTGNNSDFFTGSIDDFRIYSGVLTAEEIAELANVSPTCCLAYPYETDFEGTNVEWSTDNDWAINNVGHSGWQARSGTKFLDNNPNEIDQEYHRNHYATLTKSVFIPFDANQPTLSYHYKAAIFSGQIYSMISTDGVNWATLETYLDRNNHGEYTRRDVSLESYKGQNVQIRFRQYHNSGVGPRLFVIDDFRIGDLQADDYAYPYTNGFETPEKREEFNYEGDWNSSTAHDTHWFPSEGSYFLDNNYNNEDQYAHYSHYTTMNGFITLPAAPENPMISFDYMADIFDGYAYLQIQEYGSNTWTYLRTFSARDNHKPYTRFEYHLANYRGKKVRFRFRQYWYAQHGERVFPIDNIFVGELKETLPFPYANDFETAEEQAEWHTEGDWSVSTAHDTKWFPSTGNGFLDNNADNENQANSRNHYATMSGYVPLPADSSNVVVKFDYMLDMFDGQSYLYIQKLGQTNWTHLKTYNSQFNRDKYTEEEISLAAYAGEQVRFRFRQYYYATEGPRVFAIDNFKIENVTIEDYPYPYFNDFETAVSTPTVNGQDHWANIGDWDISQAHDELYVPASGSFFLDNNYQNKEQGNQYYHYATMKGYVQLPAAPANPMLSFDYNLKVFDGFTYVQIQREGSNTWTNIRYFSAYDDHSPYTKFEAFLSAYAGQKVRFRFRQYFYNNTPGRRVFSIDNFFVGELTKELSYPYTNTFETTAEQEDWQNEGDWNISTAHDEKWFPKSGSYFLDNNAGNENQAQHRNHYATLSGYIQLPEDSSNVVLSFDYLLNTYNGQSYIYIQRFGDSTWTNLKTFTESYNHSSYAKEEISLAAYAGKKVRFRFRQYYYTEAGPRVFAIDNFHVGEPTVPNFEYPYFNDFETAVSTPEVNGQDHWNHQGDWNISTAHDDVYFPKNGSYFLDNNADNEDQGGHYNHYVDLAGYVPIPADANSPQLSFWYRANIFNGWNFLQIQEKGSNTWVNRYTFSDSFNHNDYTRFYYDLSAYKGKSIRVRFRQYWYTSASAGRIFSVDDFRIGDDDRINLAYPYVNTFETEEEREEFNTQGDWGMSTAHDVDYVPFEGNWFMDNNINFEDQRLHLQHYSTLNGYIAIPANAELPTLTFKYKANSFDAGTYLEIKRKGENWTNLNSFTESLNHDEYVTYERSLEAYKGDEILIRFRQYWRYENGPRLFVVDNFRVGDFIQEDFIFPYYNDFDTAISTASKNGRDHWNTEGDWKIADQNNVLGSAKSGDWFLDNNPDNENQSSHYNHYAAMTGFVRIPEAAVNPKVSFDYVANIYSGYMYLYMQRENNPTWYYLQAFSGNDNTPTYKNYSRSLNSYKGESVRFRFRQYNYSPSGPRQFDIDNFTVDQELLGIWYFEENWEDATGHGFDLTPKNTPTFYDETPRAKDGPIGSDTSTCFYTGYTGGQYAVAENTVSQNVFNQLTASFWIKPDSHANNVNSIITKGDDFSVFLDSAGRVQWQYLNTQLGTSAAVPIDKWTHVAVTFKDGEQHIYIDGVSAASASVTGILTDLDEDIHIAADLNSSTNTPYADRYFEGSIDELRVYRIAQTASAISSDMDVLHECEISETPDHYRIQHDGAGLTCEAETVTIIACNDAACTEQNVEPKTVDFNVDGVLQQTLTFTGSTTVAFQQLVPKSVAMSITNPVVPALNASQCHTGSVNTCNMVFADAGFKFTYGNANSDAIAMQTSGSGFTEQLKIQAVKDSGGVCSGLFSNQTVSVALSQENILPTLKNTGKSYSANGVTLPKYDYDSAAPDYAGVNLAFDANGYAVIPSTYYDAGEIKLHALLNQGGINIKGASNNFWVKPAVLKLSSNHANPHVAGDTFDFGVTALASNNEVTENYAPNDIQLAITRLDPVPIVPSAPNNYIGGVDGVFQYSDVDAKASQALKIFESVTLNTFTAGVSASSNASYSEVGLLSIDIQDINYGGVANETVISDGAIEVGRFKPDHFDVEVASSGVYTNSCNAFTYTGQPFGYSLEPELTITAKNADGATTRNYTESTRLSNTDINIDFPTTFTETYGTTPVNSVLYNVGSTHSAGTLVYHKSVLSESNSGGSMTYTFNAGDTITYNKDANAKVPEITSSYTMTVEDFTDSDNVPYQANVNALDTIEPAGVSLRYGRLAIENNFGPETESLPIIMAAQYWDGDKFVFNNSDSCTLIDQDKLTISPASVQLKTFVNKPLVDGVMNTLVLEAPQTEVTAEIEYDLSDIAPWLQYDWDMKVPLTDDNPKASMSFGRFRGNDRVIYWREVFDNQ